MSKMVVFFVRENLNSRVVWHYSTITLIPMVYSGKGRVGVFPPC